MAKKFWTDEEKKQLEELYKQGLSFDGISKMLGRTIGAIKKKSVDLKLGDKYMRTNNPNFKAEYQDYDWCFDKIVNKNMTCAEIAKEYGYSTRVIEKWTREVHGMSNRTYRYLKHPTEKQMEMMMFGVIGDGHIDKRETQPIYIESHAENQKDYLFWKYEMLKDLCLSEPKYYPESIMNINDRTYLRKPSYRMETRIIMDLDKIRNMNRLDIILSLNEFGLSLHMLDDGSLTNGLWSLCLAEYSDEEINAYINICKKNFNIQGRISYSNNYPYIMFGKEDSKKINDIILRNIPNDLDIIKYKILEKRC